MSTRHLSRSIVVQSLYEWDFLDKKPDLKEIVKRNLEEFGKKLKDKKFVWELVNGIVKNLEDIDKIIQAAAPQWPLEKMGTIERNILRLGLYELLFGDKKAVPPKVAIDEAIELAKEFVNETSGKFVNGVLGAVFREMEKDKEAKNKKNEND
jgi:N utilization substance protein B